MKFSKDTGDWISLIFLFGVVMFIGILIGRKTVISFNHTDTASGYMVKEIGIEEYRELLASEEKAIVLISRASCKYCAIVDYLTSLSADARLPIYNLDMERYYLQSEYINIKEELGIYYVPTFFYIENGSRKYAMNNPLNPDYYDNDKSGDDLAQIRQDCIDKIDAFIDGCIGKGTVIDEEISTSSITVYSTPQKEQ